MLNSALLEYNAFTRLIGQLRLSRSGLQVCDLIYLMIISGAFLLDSLLFVVGYHTEAGFLRNRLRCAETNLGRILVCVVCYGPFNMATAALLGPSKQGVRIVFRGDLAHPVTWILRGLAVLALLLLTAASLSLFTRASNLTNRGIVRYGPYRFIRHPGYVAKNLFWLMTLAPAFVPNPNAPGFSWSQHLTSCAFLLWGMIGWGTIYVLRALTEEQFLMKDPDYVEYCRTVRYRFVPGLV